MDMKTFSQLNYNRLLIVAYRLPFKFVKKGNTLKAVQNSGGLVSAILSLSEKIGPRDHNGKNILWIGFGGLPGEKYVNDTKFDLQSVAIPESVNEKFYGGFCNDTIWPLFHYFSSLAVYDNTYYKAYAEANHLFFEEVKKVIQPGDFVWVHDYQLMLLPELIRNDFPETNMGFFLHIPFPSYELFRLLPRKWRETILRGIIGADLIGFHTNDYTQYFLRTVKRTLGYEYVNNHIYTDDRIVKVDAFPIGIDFEKFNNSSALVQVTKEKTKLKKQLSNKKFVFSVDRLDYTKGLLNRLKAYEFFLEKYPEWHEKVIFNMVVVPSRDQIERYKEMKKEIEATVGRINGNYSNLSWRPIIYQYKSLTFPELVALYNTSDVGLITPLRDGMNLVAKEYVASQKETSGMLILSEMTGAASELTEAIIINPTDVEETGDAISKALEMPQKEKQQKITRMQERLKNYNVFTWANDFFNQANEIRREQEEMSVRYIDSKVLSAIKKDYQKASSRIVFLDYDGTLIPFSKYPEQALINDKAEKVIERLTDDSKNKIVIISGRDKDFLERQFTKANVTLIAEHGFFKKEPMKDWEPNVSLDIDWKQKVIPILHEYVDRCTGSFIEEKFASLAWHYRNVDPDFAELRMNELKDNLHEILKNNLNLQILEGNKVLEIKSLVYNKGTVAATLWQQSNFEFILAIGDDKTDEDIFRAMPEKAYTIKVGTTLSFAKFNLRRQKNIYDLFQDLVS
jgi:trehalose 6-phosphate synthase/phosphatase